MLKAKPAANINFTLKAMIAVVVWLIYDKVPCGSEIVGNSIERIWLGN